MSSARTLLLGFGLLAAGCSFETGSFTLQPGVTDVPAVTDRGADVVATDVPAPQDVVTSSDVVTDPDVVAPMDVVDDAAQEDGTVPTDAVIPTDEPPVDAPACGGGPACGIGTLCCGGQCIDVQSDMANCGACGNACRAGQSCCAGACQDTQGSTVHCGRCNSVCEFPNASPACRAGQCALDACAMGYGNCDGNAMNGCEAELQTDLSHCGTCGRACTAGPNARATCAAGACQLICARGFEDCNRNPVDGCEANTASPTSCGACGNVCPARANATPTCTAGACSFTCSAGFADCDGDPANGCEVNTGTSATDCGGCGLSCTRPNATGTCTAGTCSLVCANGFANCDSNPANGCERAVSTDVNNCGACGRVCASGQLCSGGICRTSCVVPTVLCSGACVDTNTDVRNCGRCGNVCPAPANGTAACVAGVCGVGTCNAGFGDCDRSAANGCEVNLTSTPAHCGACGDACSTANNTPACVSSNCRLTCNAGFADCDGSVDTGCETSIRSVSNCGACGRACTVANATPSCASGTCAVGACNTGWADCDRSATNGCETNLLGDNSNCGGCGVACRVGTACSRGVCSSVCATGLTLCSGRCVDLQSDESNCGACGRTCSTFFSCLAGSCGFRPPPNDTCANATVINLAAGSRIDLAASTSFATHNLNAPCYGNGLGDVFFTFTLTRREIVYADTFGASWDTKLFFASNCATPLTRTARPGELLCDDNLGSACTQGGTASQVTAILDPGTYYLVLSVQSGSGGSATVHFEHLPAGNGTVNFLSSTSSVVSGTTSGTGLVRSSTCGGSGPENTYFWQTCPGAVGGTMTASTCGRATWDTVLHVSHGNGTSACNGDGASCAPQSQLSAPVPAGAGLHVLYIDGFSTAQGAYSMSVTRPASQ